MSRLRMLAQCFLHSIDVGATRSGKCKIVATSASLGGPKARVADDFVPVFTHRNVMLSNDPRRHDMARRATHTDVTRFEGRLGLRVRERRVTTAAKGERLDGVRVLEVFVFPCAMMQRLFPLGGDFRVTPDAALIFWQTNARDRFEAPARRGTWKRNVERAARAAPQQHTADECRCDGMEREPNMHGMQDAGEGVVVSTVTASNHPPLSHAATPTPSTADILAT